MDEKPSLPRRLYATSIWLGIALLLAEGFRPFISRLLRRLLPLAQMDTEKVASLPRRSAVAFLVDGENISSTLTKSALKRADELGEIVVKRVYGSCNTFETRWHDVCLSFALEQVHLTKPTKNKNTADIALAVDAVELAKDGKCNSFCIMTSDSDFTPLVRRLRTLNCQVLGIGERKTPNSLIKACNQFVYTDQLGDVMPPAYPSLLAAPTLLSAEPTNGHRPGAVIPVPPIAQAGEKSLPTVATILTEAYLDAVYGKEGEWMLLSRLGLSLRKLYPEFKATAYAEDLSDLIKKYDSLFEFGKRANGHPQMRLKV